VANGWLFHWRIGLFGPPWFRVMRRCWGMYRAGVPIVCWEDVKDLCNRLDIAVSALREIAEPGSMGVTDIARRALTQIDTAAEPK
jgi:hypothetical protein